jgi:hypothetical protein
MGPHGDRRDRTKSAGIEGQEDRSEWEHDVVRVFVLSDDLRHLDAWRLLGGPCEKLTEREAVRKDTLDVVDDPNADVFDGVDGDSSHGWLYGYVMALVS